MAWDQFTYVKHTNTDVYDAVQLVGGTGILINVQPIQGKKDKPMSTVFFSSNTDRCTCKYRWTQH